MPIKIIVEPKEVERVKKLGALWLPGEGTWVIPDTVKKINSFRRWLPDDEGYIVQRPYFVVKTKRACLKCGKETPIVALGAKNYHSLFHKTENRGSWRRIGYPTLFSDITYLDEEIVQSLQEYYPFFQYAHSYCDEYPEEYGESEDSWVNTCVHCKTVQEDIYNFMDGNAPLSPIYEEEMSKLHIVYFKLRFDYYIQAGEMHSPLFEEMMKGR
jgi:hypothetical protein